MLMVEFAEAVTVTAPRVLLEPETMMTVVAFPEPMTPPAVKTFPEPKSVIVVCED